MSQEVQQEGEETTKMYLGMIPGQFGMLMSLTSLSRQMPELIEGQQMDDLMTKLISEHPEKTDAETLDWVRGQRNHVLNILHAVLVSQNMLAQIDDALVAKLIAPAQADETVQTA